MWSCLFPGKLGPQAVELLATYLTAPYLRIPLILNFFATPEHLQVLKKIVFHTCYLNHSAKWTITCQHMFF